MLRKHKAILIALPLSVTGLIGVGPLVLYGMGLLNIEGRPTAPSTTNVEAKDEASLRCELKGDQDLSVPRLNPYNYLLKGYDTNPDRRSTGLSAVWVVARDYNQSHLKNRRAIYWHLSGASLSIWITRNWSDKEILSSARSILRTREATSNQPMERTLPRCALQRRSSAR